MQNLHENLFGFVSVAEQMPNTIKSINVGQPVSAGDPLYYKVLKFKNDPYVPVDIQGFHHSLWNNTANIGDIKIGIVSNGNTTYVVGNGLNRVGYINDGNYTTIFLKIAGATNMSLMVSVRQRNTNDWSRTESTTEPPGITYIG